MRGIETLLITAARMLTAEHAGHIRDEPAALLKRLTIAAAKIGPLPRGWPNSAQQFGFLLRGRFVQGFTWRFVAGADVGFATRTFSNIDHYNVSDPATGPRSYGLNLADTSQKNLLVAPSAGVEWAGDHFTIGLTPRVEFLFGSVRTWAVSLPLGISWSWYL